MDLRCSFLGGDQRKARGQIEAHLVAEDGRVPVPVRSRFSTPFFSASSIRSRYWRIFSGFRRRFSRLLKLTASAYIGKAGQPAMAINDCVISGPDPGAVPGASTTSPLSTEEWVSVGAKQDRRTCKDCSFARYGSAVIGLLFRCQR